MLERLKSDSASGNVLYTTDILYQYTQYTSIIAIHSITVPCDNQQQWSYIVCNLLTLHSSLLVLLHTEHCWYGRQPATVSF